MTEDRDNETLAAQAAAWVPPWHRRADEPAEPVESAEAVGSAEPAEPGEPPRSAEPDEPGSVGSVGSTGSVGSAEQAEPARPAHEPRVVHEPEAEPGEIVDEWGADDEPEDGVDEPDTAAPRTPVGVVEAVDDAGRFDDDDEDEPLPATADLGAALEAILLVVDEPVGEAMLADVLDATIPEVTARLERLAAEYTAQGRGFDLRRAAGGWRLYTRGEYAAYVERFVLDGQSVRLTQAALETLAVIAYQQPVTRSRISAIRGVNCDGVVRTLMTRGLIEECGTQPESGAFLYRTTSVFLEKLGLDSVEDLPPLAPFLPDDVNGLADAQHQ